MTAIASSLLAPARAMAADLHWLAHPQPHPPFKNYGLIDMTAFDFDKIQSRAIGFAEKSGKTSASKCTTPRL